MDFLSVAEIAKKWGISERSVRNYCAQGRIPGAFVMGKTWNIPATAVVPERLNRKSAAPTTLLEVLKLEKKQHIKGGIYHKIQIDLTYNSNHMEGSCLSHDQTRYIYETNTIGAAEAALNVDDILEAANHFRCIDMVIDFVHLSLSERFIKQLHGILKNGTGDSRKAWFAVGEYKRLPNEVGGKETCLPEAVPDAMRKLLAAYNEKKEKTLDELLEFHYRFECIHPFQDGNGRIGRLILFKECLRNNIVPFIIEDEYKLFYYRGLANWEKEKGYLRDTCLLEMDRMKAILDYFRVPYIDAFS